MKVSVHFEASYIYEEPVSFSPHRFRLFPKTDHYVTLLEHEFTTNASADVQFRRDLFDNPIALGVYRDRETTLTADLRLELEIAPRNAFHFLLAPHALEFPFRYTEQEEEVLGPCLLPRYPAFENHLWQTPKTPVPTVGALVGLNDAIFEGLRYERREEGVAMPPGETLALGAGTCRDYMVLLAETLRRAGAAARMVSGYICEFEAEEKKAEAALHAWVEVYLPGAGWVGLDPTNGSFANHNHIAAAVGLHTEDVSPISGNYYHDHAVKSVMTSTVQILERT